MRNALRMAAACTGLSLLLIPGNAGAQDYTPPDWGTPSETVHVYYDSGETPAVNGATLKSAVLALTAGQRLVVHEGTYYIGSYFGPTLNGSYGAPIVIERSGADTVEVSSDVSHNILELWGSYVIIRGFTFTGGSMGIRLHACDHVWMDECHIHHTDEAALTANQDDTHHIYITNNEIDHIGGSAEGMYLGANWAAVIMHSSFIIGNHVHDTYGTQGDGIELKQGSWGNLIADNLVHDCNYPCIIVYGTGGMPQNVVERNICYNSGDNVLQVQGEAIVRNNLLINGGAHGIHSHDHQGSTTNLQVVNNTIITPGTAAHFSSWSGRENMVFANNACYSQSGVAISFPGGSAGVTVTGNVFLGSAGGLTGGYVVGNSLEADFVDVSYDATRRNARPTEMSALVGVADPAYMPANDITGAARTGGAVAGAYDLPTEELAVPGASLIVLLFALGPVIACRMTSDKRRCGRLFGRNASLLDI